MSTDNFHLLNSEMADILEIESISDQENLRDNPAWDSLAILSALAFIDKNYDIQLNNADIADLQNLGSLKDLLASKSAGG